MIKAKYCFIFLMSLSLYSCDWGFDKTTQDPKYSTNKGTFAQKPCEENEDTNIKYSALVDSVQNSFSFQKSFDEMKNAISLLKEVKKLQEDSNCLISQNGKLETVRKKCEEMKLSSEQLVKSTGDEDAKERIVFYNQMIELLNE